MGQHKITYHTTSYPLMARCRCGWNTTDKSTIQQVEDEVYRHEQEIDRLRLRLGTSTPSMKSQRDYYREKANSPETPDGDRPIWRQLADELDHRLNDATPSLQDELPFI